MQPSEFFFISAGIAVWIIIAIIVFLGFKIYFLISKINKTIEKIRFAIEDVEMAGKTVKVGVLGVVSTLLGKLAKGGD